VCVDNKAVAAILYYARMERMATPIGAALQTRNPDLNIGRDFRVDPKRSAAIGCSSAAGKIRKSLFRIRTPSFCIERGIAARNGH
jgi:hypothetical protein